MEPSQITANMVKRAIRGIKYPESRTDTLLLRTKLVSAYLRQEGRVSSDKAAWQALKEVIGKCVQDHRPRPPAPSAVTAGGSPRLVGSQDSTVPPASDWSIDEGAWEALFLWVFAVPTLESEKIGLRLGLEERTVDRRKVRCYTLLADTLQVMELNAEARTEEGPASTRDKTAVREESPPYGEKPNQQEESERHARVILDALLRAIQHNRDLPILGRSDLNAINELRPVSIQEYLLKRAAAWQGRPHLDQRFIDLSLWLDMKGEPGKSPPTETNRHFATIEDALSELEDRLVVLVGQPGSGKTTLLRHLDYTAARDAAVGQNDKVPFLVRLDAMPQIPAKRPIMLRAWLLSQWSQRFAQLPSLSSLIAEGRLLLLLDGLNEIPHRDFAMYQRYARQWREYAHEVLETHSGNRIVVSCRTLDYTTPLSSDTLRVPRLEIKPLDDVRLRGFLHAFLPNAAESVWAQVKGTPFADVLRVPYNLRMVIDTVHEGGEIPSGHSGIFTGFIRSALEKEIRWGNPYFDAGPVLSEVDLKRIGSDQGWRTEWELPDNGPLFRGLSTLAVAMHEASRLNVSDSSAFDYDDALRALAHRKAIRIIDAGLALGLLYHHRREHLLEFSHAQMQAYFIGRQFARIPEPDRVARAWAAEEVSPTVQEHLAQLHPAEPLPPLAQTDWEEPTSFAVEMSSAPHEYISAIASVNLAFAGRCAAIPTVHQRLSDDVVDSLRLTLLKRSRDNQADLRDRIACGHALGDLGDPRFPLCPGPLGPYVQPPTVRISGGDFLIGHDAPLSTAISIPDAHRPSHSVSITSFSIGMFTVTNEEWQLFMESGGYDTELWWDTQASKDWRAGLITGATMRQDDMDVAAYYRANRDALDAQHANGTLDTKRYAFWLDRIGLTGDAEAAWLREKFPDRLIREPANWKDEHFNRPTQPVVGVSWFEARAYCAWLSAQTSKNYRLPTEVEWEAAARGNYGSHFPYGSDPDHLRANTVETHLRQPTPAGVFPSGDTPTGICDMAGNIGEWTSSTWGTSDKAPDFPYPYSADDGREAADVSFGVRRITRGGSTFNDIACAQSFIRGITLPGLRVPVLGFRVVLDESSTSPRSKR